MDAGADDILAQVLSQSEVENLLAQVTEEENTLLVHTAENRQVRLPKDRIQPYDFRHPVFLSQGELRRLRLRHEEFLRALAAQLSLYLRMEFTLQMSKLQTLLYKKFTESLGNPTHLTLFRAEPLPGVCILEITPRLGLTLVDRLLGGPAHSVNPNHDFTEIELALLQQAVQVILGEWCNHWRGIQELRPVLLGQETNGRFLQTSPHDTVMLVLCMEARIGDCMEAMQIGFPYYTLEPLIRELSRTLDASTADRPAASADAPLAWDSRFDEVPVPLCAGWSGLEMAVRDVAALKVGDIVELSPSSAEQVSVRLDDSPRFRGRLGTRDGRWAVQLIEPRTE
ncbi:MAG: FliM/FliN family flagellar motor switch protein [Verrucomicrobiae bacterium]|nr:FliM/FliN family flagellar motor switch protein [Verrucomicrobiae bacterium]